VTPAGYEPERAQWSATLRAEKREKRTIKKKTKSKRTGSTDFEKDRALSGSIAECSEKEIEVGDSVISDSRDASGGSSSAASPTESCEKSRREVT